MVWDDCVVCDDVAVSWVEVDVDDDAAADEDPVVDAGVPVVPAVADGLAAATP